MENNSNRKLLLIVGLVLFFAIIIIVWYFFYAKPAIAPSLERPTNPIRENTFSSRFQFLNWNNQGEGTSTTEVTNALGKPLIRVWSKPSTSGTFITDQILKEVEATTTEGTSTKVITIKKTIRATSTVLIFVDKTTGYIYGYPIETGKVFQISNTIVPGVNDAHFFNNGSRVIMRYIDQTKNKVVAFIATVPAVSETGTALPLSDIRYLTGKVVSITTNQDKTEASYVVATDKSSSIYTLKDKEPTLIVNSPFREWDLSYGGNKLYVTTKPSAYIEGITFNLPLFQPEITGKTGLMSTPYTEGLFLNSMWSNRGLVTFLSNNNKIRIANFATLAPKCSWGEKAYLVCAIPRELPLSTEGLPDDWFQGRVTFNDDLFFIDKNSGEKYSLYSFKKDDGLFDIINISLSKENDLISFNKKQSETLWLLNTNLLTVD